MNMRRCCFQIVIIATCLLGSVAVCQAQIAFTVSLNTAPLIGSAAGPYAIDFQLIDGSGTNDANNTAIIHSFAFGGGSGTGSPALSGGASGSLASAVTLIDSSFFSEFTQTFSPGNVLTFAVQLGTNVDAGSTPDKFAFLLLDGNGSQIPTGDSAGSFLSVDINSANPAIQTFAALSPYADLGIPTIGGQETPPAPIVPEPASAGGFAGGLLAFLACMFFRATASKHFTEQRYR